MSARSVLDVVEALGGMPAGEVNLITNDPADAAEIVGRLIEHPMTAHINFTGSTAVGRIIALKAAPLFKRTLLELGGKAPLVVLDDADLDAAAAAASFGAFMHSGQICMSTERVVVDEAVADPLVEKLVARAESLATGSPFEDVLYGGQRYPIAQCNNSYVFPGVGWGVLAVTAVSPFC